MPFHELMNELGKLAICRGSVRLDTAVTRSKETHDFTVVLGYLDKRIGAKKHLDSFVASFPVSFDNDRSDLCHL